MQRIEGFDFATLTAGGDGALQNVDEVARLDARITAVGATDLIVFVHGFRHDERDATRRYAAWLRAFAADLSRAVLRPRLQSRRFLIAGLYWPATAFPETLDEGDAGTEGSRDVEGVAGLSRVAARVAALASWVADPAAAAAAIDRARALVPALAERRGQDQFVAELWSLLRESASDTTEGASALAVQPGSELLARIDRSRGMAGSLPGRVNQFLNLLTWYLMKERAGSVGARALADAVRRLKATHPALKIQLVGHSLGARVVAACASALSAPPAVPLDSLTLLQAAFSHFGFSADNGFGTPGFFRPVVARAIVSGPLLATCSADDRLLGGVYALVSRLAGDASRALGDEVDPYGALGRNGAQRTAEAVAVRLSAPNTPYAFSPNRITSLDGSGGVIAHHGDVANPHVSYAFAAALAQT